MAKPEGAPQYVRSLLDTDLYKLTMQQAVLHHFPQAQVTYRFTNRTPTMQFNKEALGDIKVAIQHLATLQLQPDEEAWLRNSCPYLKPPYLDYLRAFQFHPSEQVSINLIPSSENPTFGQIDVQVTGTWAEVILYEVPLMAIISEAYFVHVDRDWSYEDQRELAYSKGKKLFEHGVMLSEFGTRRRRSYHAQDLAIENLVKASNDLANQSPGKLTGTSNLHFAMKHSLLPIGTVAHEWTMGIAALKGYENANTLACQHWEEAYPASTSHTMLIALTDTFSSDVFFKDVSQDRGILERWRGVRQDSGDPFVFIRTAEAAYRAAEVNPKEKLIIFSDSLDVKKCIEIKEACDKTGFASGYGVGTSITNDFKTLSTGEKSKPLNIVIKLATINDQPCIKISDDLTKNTGAKEIVETVKSKLGILPAD